MRSPLVFLVLAACGQNGLLLDVHGTKDAKISRVEVFIPDGAHDNGMGMPPAQSAKTEGTVYSVITTATADASGNTAQVLLQPGTIDQVPALLVLGYDGNHTAIGYALITDPNGPIMLRHTTSDEIVVNLDPISEVSVQASRATSNATRLARWSAQAIDVNDGPCVAVLHPDGTGDFFGPGDDKDFDGAAPECDDTWYLHSVGAGRCATQMPPPSDDTQDACRIGTTAGCTDNVSNSGGCMAAVGPGVCAPVTVCDQCQDLISSTCIKAAVQDGQTASIQCTAYVNTETGASLLCPVRTTTIDMKALFGDPWACDGIAGFADFLNSTAPASTPLRSTTDTVDFACHVGTTTFSFAISGTSDAVDSQLLPTAGTVVFGVQPGQMTSPTHVLALPFLLTLQTVAPCPAEGITCTFVPGLDNGQPYDDPMWHCAGR